MAGHSRAGDRPPDCCGQRRRKGRPGRAASSALLLHGDYIRILGRPTVRGGAPRSGCSFGISHRQEVLWLLPLYTGRQKGVNREKNSKVLCLKAFRVPGGSESLKRLRQSPWEGQVGSSFPCIPLSDGFLGSFSWPYFFMGDQTHLK